MGHPGRSHFGPSTRSMSLQDSVPHQPPLESLEQLGHEGQVHGAQYNSIIAFDLPQPVAGTRLSCVLPAQLDPPLHIQLSDHAPVSGTVPIFQEISEAAGFSPAKQREIYSPRTFIASALPSGPWGEKVLVKYAVNKAVRCLENEAEFYHGPLRQLWDVAVPRCLGFFQGRHGQHTVACLVLEYCSAHPPAEGMRFDSCELVRQMILSAAKLHSSGIYHGSLLLGDQPFTASLRHFVVKTDDAGRLKVFVVDFASASRHVCHNARPSSPYFDDRSEAKRLGCTELAQMETYFGHLA